MWDTASLFIIVSQRTAVHPSPHIGLLLWGELHTNYILRRYQTLWRRTIMGCYIFLLIRHQHIHLLLQAGHHSPLYTVQSVVVYNLAFPIPSAFYTQSPSCHDTRPSINTRVICEATSPVVQRTEGTMWACSRADHRSIHCLLRESPPLGVKTYPFSTHGEI